MSQEEKEKELSSLRGQSWVEVSLKTQRRRPGRVLALSLPEKQTPEIQCSRGRVSRSRPSSVLQALTMADTYAVVQKRRAPPSAGTEAAAPTPEGPVYSQVMMRARRPQAPAEDAQGALLGRAPADPGPTGPGAYEDVANGAQLGGLGFNLRIGRPKGPRDPPAEWTQA